MGTLFEPAFGGYLPLDFYNSENFAPFGPPVNFEVGCVRLDGWKNDPTNPKLEASSGCEMPDLSSQPSSPYSSRPTSFHSQSEASSFSSLPDPEPCTSGIEPLCVDYSTDIPWQRVWTDLDERAFSPLPPDYSFVNPSLNPYAISPPLELFDHGKIEKLTYSVAGSESFTSHSYPYIHIGRSLLLGQSDLGREDSLCGYREYARDRCPELYCGKVFKDLKAHMLTHVKERPEKCPILTCDYSIKGFSRKYDKHRHTLTHYKGIMICSFCPVHAPDTFQRADVFKRHLTSIHGAEHMPPSSSRKSSRSKTSTISIESSRRLSSATEGICSICLLSFESVQNFYNHLDDCIINCVLQQLSNPDGSPSVDVTTRPDQNQDMGIETNPYSDRISEPHNQITFVKQFSNNPTKKLCSSIPRLERRASEIFRVPENGASKEKERRFPLPRLFASSTAGKAHILEMINDVSVTHKRKSCSLSGGVSAKQVKTKHQDLSMLFHDSKHETTLPDDIEAPINLAGYIRSQDHEIGQKDNLLFKQWLRELEGLDDWKAKEFSLPFADQVPLLTTDKDRSDHSDGRYFSAPSNEAALKIPTPSTCVSRVGVIEETTLNAVAKASPDLGLSVLDPSPEKSRVQTVSCTEETLDEINDETDLVLSSRCDSKPSTIDVPKDKHGNFAPSPETDYSKDVSDDESVSDCSTDWGEDQFTSTPASDVYRILEDLPNDCTEGDKSPLRPILSPMKQDLVDRIMTEFWSIVNQEWTSNLTKCAGETPTSSSPPGSNGSLVSGSSPQMAHRKRQRDEGEDPPPDDGNGRNPKRPNSQSERSLPKTGNNFACPYRKHAPHKYTIYNHRSCALSRWDSVARVKEHLYRRHRVPIQCKRCWQTFKTDTALDAHLTVINICALEIGQAAEGLTTDQEKRLKSRKKSSPDQSEEARWKEIYGILFPNEVVPNPYFEPVQENMPQSPDSRNLADYEEYSRQELPRYFRSYLENAVNNQTQHLEEDLRSRLVNIVQDCQAQMFSDYRSRVITKENKPIHKDSAIEECVTPPASQGSEDKSLNLAGCESKDIVSSVFAPTPETTLQYLPDLRDLGTQLKDNLECAPAISFSDSAYSSCPSGSEPTTVSFEATESTVGKAPDDLCDQLLFKDGGGDGDVLHELSFEEYCNINMDINDHDFSMWANPDNAG